MIELNYECDQCKKFNQYIIDDERNINCNGCKKKFGTINVNWGFNSNCLFCQKNNFYKRKNFNQLIGLFIILLGGGLAIWFYQFYGPLSYLLLLLFSIIDLILFKYTRYIGVCYSCSCEYINIKGVDLLSDFDHHQLEMYQE